MAYWRKLYRWYASLFHILIVTPVIFAWLREREVTQDHSFP